MSFRFAVSATFTAEPIAQALEFWSKQLDTPFEVRFAPYNQLVQALLDPSGEFAANTQGVNVVLARLEDLGQFDTVRIESNLHHVTNLLRDAPQYTSVPLIFVLCPPSSQFLADAGRARFSHDTAMRAEAMLDGTPGVVFLSYDEIQRLYPVDDASNTLGQELAQIPYNDLYFAALGTAIVRMANGLAQPPFKVIALDCDNTLWKGICGEDGPQGVVPDEPRRRLQTFMRDQREVGMLLVMASKNNEQDVLDTFAYHPEMPLQLRHFVDWRLNWDSKAANLSSLARELSLGLDSFIFVDDNPKECAEVEEGLPDVLALSLPAVDADIQHFLEHVWAFDHLLVTEEDRNRSAYYAQAQNFGRELRRADTLEHFLVTLDLRVRLSPLSPDRVARVAQLTQRTNQFNVKTIRRNEAEVQALLSGDSLRCWTVDVSDRFGDYGLTGVVIFEESPSVIEVETFLLSCRVLGRGVEHEVMAWLGQHSLERGLDAVVVRFQPTSKNVPARQFLESLRGSTEDGAYRFGARDLVGIKWTPSVASEVGMPRATSNGKRRTSQKRPDHARIARELSTPGQILLAIRSALGPTVEAALTETEGALARIWVELLHRPDVTAASNFFDLGGHSLLVVLLLVRIRESFGVQLSIDDVYAPDLTLRDLARRIEILQLGDASEYEALLREIEDMSEEEVARLLAEEDREQAQS